MRDASSDPQAEGDARRPAGGGNQIRRAARREAVPGCTGKPGDRPARPLGMATRTTAGQTGPTRGPRGLPGCPHLVSCDLRLLDRRVSADGRDRRQAGWVLEAEVGDQPSPSRVTVPRIFVPQVPDQWRGVSCHQVRPGPSSGSGSGSCQAYSKPRRQSPPTYTNIRLPWMGWQGGHPARTHVWTRKGRGTSGTRSFSRR
jgi:hypothetical protein